MRIVISDHPDHTFGATTPPYEVAFKPEPTCTKGSNHPALFDLLAKHKAFTLPEGARFYNGKEGITVYWPQNEPDFHRAHEFAEKVQAAISQTMTDFWQFEAMLDAHKELHQPK